MENRRNTVKEIDPCRQKNTRADTEGCVGDPLWPDKQGPALNACAITFTDRWPGIGNLLTETVERG
ncbi:hypothetical protein ATN37_04295 [Rhodococcus sp. MH15]|nr:hypothetical protein [Rhodococcus sp. MH15]